MKSRNKFFIVALTALVMLLPRCSKKLEEQPYTVFTVDYFKTPSGFQNGVYALYSGMRFLYGPEGAVNIGCAGTDEWSMGGEVRRQVGSDLYTLCDYSMDNTSGAILTPWNRSFNNINLANGLVEYAKDVAIPDAAKNTLLGEIRFLRGLYYFNLVQYFGAVPLDLGSGDLKFNQKPFQGFNRLPTAEIFVKDYQLILEDFTFATQNLPDKRPADAFKLSKSAAFHMLAKAYLHRSYSAAKQPTDTKSAYDAAMELINNQAKYGVALQANYADVHKPNNDYNSEILLSIERIPGNFAADEVGDPPNTIGGGKGVDAANDFCGDYTSVRSPTIQSGTKPVNTRTVQYGRPIRRMCPTPWLFNVAFADKFNDSRYEGSFRTVYIASVTGGGFTANTDTGFVMALSNRIADSLNGIVPAGPRLKPYRVIAPREFYFVGGSVDQSDLVTSNMYPSLSKYEDPGKGLANNPGSRPFVVAKLSETYLMAAEAGMILNNKAQAMDFINILKLRAAYRPGLAPAEVTNRYNVIKLTDANQVTLDYILDERTRELCGESIRWPDLAARGKLIERAKLYNTDAAPKITANKHELRPIPREQLDRVTDADKGKYQNPGY
ncbi:RagB/SusD family nutrient uptake outer membrane protein [Paraflavitalea sp. CAU 1676]|uniref:RagB/SusD family nutrient uptake outer membrane protein n=1 Tax=Paraflavitalea sp. CAU 1676 TaxID=3032598 RepID=UPI0023DC40F9|nr:RagB/SusD family nutrient uptake outer membrane protein [Paraflavitalea sp. CAU 1676]MDF2192291.1 RagB/SusD family nutrient uptake outer membrane protein [Paraflavitalea sp. CAU 1676]